MVEKIRPSLELPPNIPLALESNKLASLSGEPLLCYLLALSGYIGDKWEEAALNHNLIYRDLINKIWERTWGDGRAGTGKHLKQDEFNLLMDFIGWAAWRGGDSRTATWNIFAETLKLDNAAKTAWENFEVVCQKKEAENFGNLALNFYLKGTDANLQGFEFTHKSFGEYLAVRAIFKFAQGRDIETAKLENALTNWLEAMKGELTTELLEFVRYEARLILKEKGGAR